MSERRLSLKEMETVPVRPVLEVFIISRSERRLSLKEMETRNRMQSILRIPYCDCVRKKALSERDGNSSPFFFLDFSSVWSPKEGSL